MFFADRRQRTDFLDDVDQTRLGRLGDRDHLGLREVDVRPRGHERPDRFGPQLAILGCSCQELGPVGEELRCAALVGFHVGGTGANNAVVGLAKRRLRQRICGGPIESKEDLIEARITGPS